MNSYLVTFDYSQYLVQHSMNDPEGRKTTIHRYLIVLALVILDGITQTGSFLFLSFGQSK